MHVKPFASLATLAALLPLAALPAAAVRTEVVSHGRSKAASPTARSMAASATRRSSIGVHSSAVNLS